MKKAADNSRNGKSDLFPPVVYGSTRAEGRREPFESAWRSSSTDEVHCSLQYFRQSSYENKSLVAGKSEIGHGLGPISEIYANRGGAKLTGFLEAFRLIFDLVAQLVEQPRWWGERCGFESYSDG